MSGTVLLIAVLAPVLGAAAAVLLPGPAGRAAQAAAGLVGVGFAAAVIAGVLALFGAGVGSMGPLLGDPLALMLLNLVLGLSWLIQLYALRYLRGDSRQRWFAGWANALTASTAVLVCAGTVVWFALAWVAAGISLVLLLRTYPHLPQARQGVARTAASFVVADLALVLAVMVLVVIAGGDVPFGELGQVLAGLPVGAQLAIALGLVVAALARSGQLPFHTWLPATLAAPTPVSASLHAGVVNAGAILVIRFAEVIAGFESVMLIIFGCGAATLLYATAVRLVKPDVKGRLVASTAGQMGFMMMAVGLGAFAAAVFHLIAHALFKSALFLSAGTAVRVEATQRHWPHPEPRTRVRTAIAVTLGIVLPVAALTLALVVTAPEISPASLGLLGFLALTAGVAIHAGLARTLTVTTVATATVGVTALAVFYLGFLSLFGTELSPSTPVAGASPWLLLIPAAGLLALELASRPPRHPRGVHHTAYAWAVAAATIPPTGPVTPVPRPLTTAAVPSDGKAFS